MRFRSTRRPALALHQPPAFYNLLLCLSVFFQFLSASDVLISKTSSTTKAAAKQTRNHKRNTVNQLHPNGFQSSNLLILNPADNRLNRELLSLLDRNNSDQSDAKSNVRQLSQFDNPLLNQLRKQQNLVQKSSNHINSKINNKNKINDHQPNARIQPKRSLLRDKKIEPVRNSVDYDLATLPKALQTSTVKSTFQIFPFLKLNFSSKKNRSDKEEDLRIDNSLDSVLKKSVDENVLISGHYHSFADSQVPENKFYTFCRQFRESFLSVHGYLSLSVCIFGIIANILNIIVLTRWVLGLIFM